MSQRRNIFWHCLTTVLAACLLANSALPTLAAEPVEIGSRLELFVDDYLIGELAGEAKQVLQLPEPKEVVFQADQPWEGNTSGYYCLFQDGDQYRMIYRGWQHDEDKAAAHPETTCYAESTDGIHWTRPKVGLFEWNGSKENNIVWFGPGSHNFAAFRDDNPDASPESRYKALASGGKGMKGLQALESPDLMHWKLIQEQPVITNGAFDSQNLAFYDREEGGYRAYWRFFDQKVRAIRTAVSTDFLRWEQEADLAYSAGTPNEHLYTNAIQKYFRAPHLFIGFPTRFEPKSEEVEPVLMMSRDGQHFTRYAEPVIPRTAPQDRNHNRSNYMAWGMLQLPNSPREISVYGTENYYEKTPGRVRRFVYRTDGFVALRGNDSQDQVTTKPLRYKGEKLLLNYRTTKGGQLLVEVLNEGGTVIGKSAVLQGDAIDSPVKWEQDPKLAGGVAQLRFTLRGADLYSLKFE